LPREPQSYGSTQDWVTGKTDQQVNEQKSTPAPEHESFYDERRSSEHNAPSQGGKTSDLQLAENAQVSGQSDDATDPATKVTARESGAKRDSYFKKRDYE